MAGTAATSAPVPDTRAPGWPAPGTLAALWRYSRRNPSLSVGVALLLGLVLFSVIGAFAYGVSKAQPLSVVPAQPPSAAYPFGTDTQGRDLLAAMIAGTPLTATIGVTAGLVGVLIGTVLAFVAAYYRGIVDTLIKGFVDIRMTIPGLLVLIIIAIAVQGNLSLAQMALVVACLAWLQPTRVIRSQVLTLRARAYVEVARLSGMSGPAIIVKEMMPNLLPYLGAQLVSAAAAATLASIGLEALGLGPLESPTLGMTLYWVISNNGLMLGLWWWFMPPVMIIIILFLGLFNLSVGLDEIANPRLRRSA